MPPSPRHVDDSPANSASVAPAAKKLPEPPKMRVVTKGWWVREEAPQTVEALRDQERK